MCFGDDKENFVKMLLMNYTWQKRVKNNTGIVMYMWMDRYLEQLLLRMTGTTWKDGNLKQKSGRTVARKDVL